MKFNEKLLEIRKKQGLSQEELGMELQVSRLEHQFLSPIHLKSY